MKFLQLKENLHNSQKFCTLKITWCMVLLFTCINVIVSFFYERIGTTEVSIEKDLFDQRLLFLINNESFCHRPNTEDYDPASKVNYGGCYCCLNNYFYSIN